MSRKRIAVAVAGTYAAIALVFAVLAVYTSETDAHRPIGQDRAQRYANRQVRRDACGRPRGWSCVRVSVPIVNCGYHRYCWRGPTHEECKKLLGFCYTRRTRESSGNVNGHTGRTVVTKVW